MVVSFQMTFFFLYQVFERTIKVHCEFPFPSQSSVQCGQKYHRKTFFQTKIGGITAKLFNFHVEISDLSLSFKICERLRGQNSWIDAFLKANFIKMAANPKIDKTGLEIFHEKRGFSSCSNLSKSFLYFWMLKTFFYVIIV